jgi:hypothetical protein
MPQLRITDQEEIEPEMDTLDPLWKLYNYVVVPKPASAGSGATGDTETNAAALKKRN